MNKSIDLSYIHLTEIYTTQDIFPNDLSRDLSLAVDMIYYIHVARIKKGLNEDRNHNFLVGRQVL